MTTNSELREMAQTALDNWFFDKDTDPDGAIKKGLEFLADDGEWDDQAVIDARFDDLPKGQDKWDALEEWAKFLGS